MTLAEGLDRADATVETSNESLLRLSKRLRELGYAFTTITPLSHSRINARPGNTQAKSLTDVFGWSRPFAPDLLPSDVLAMLQEADAVEPEGGLLRSRIRLSTLRSDLYIHSAYPTLATDSVFFGPDTYKFCDAIADFLPRAPRPIRRAVDICAGGGPGAMTIAKFAPEAEVFMADINPQALRYASVNAAAAGCSNAQARNSNILAGVDGAFDLIVTHPPYLVDRESRAYRHGGGALGADLPLAIVRAALDRLAPGGTLLTFTGVAIVDGVDQFETTFAPWLEFGFDWTYREVDPDVFGEELDFPAYAQTDRIALRVLEATRRRTQTS